MAAISYADQNAYNFQDYALNSNDPAVKTTAFMMIEASSLFTYVPVIIKPTLKVNGTRITGDLPAPTWTDVNNGPTINKDPDPEWWDDAFYIHRDAAQVDDLLLRDENQINDPFELKIKAKIQGISYDRNYRLIQGKHNGAAGDPRVNPKAFVGIRERLDHPEVYGCNPECKIDGGGVNLGTAGTNADGWQLEYLLEALFDAMGSPDGTDIILTMNAKAKRSLNRSIKKGGNGGGFRYDKDAFDRTVEKYMNATILNCGRNTPTGGLPARTQVPIISETETADGSADTGGSFTSIYAFRVGVEHFYGWQFEPMKPTEPFLLPDGTTWQSNINHGIGIASPDTRALGRVFHIGIDGTDGTN